MGYLSTRAWACFKSLLCFELSVGFHRNRCESSFVVRLSLAGHSMFMVHFLFNIILKNSNIFATQPDTSCQQLSRINP